MQPQYFQIQNIPCALWGEDSDRVIIAVHGAQSHKEDKPFSLLAETLGNSQVLSFDLPEHGARQGEATLCKPPACVRELTAVMDYTENRWPHIGLFAVSIGVYFSLLAYGSRRIEQAWFLSPVVDLGLLIKNMMNWFHISPERLEREQVIPTPMGQTLYWDYFCYVQEHPILRWSIPTEILAGGQDLMCDPAVTAAFSERYFCRIQIAKDAEHWFHTEGDLRILKKWIQETGGDFIR